MNFSEFYNIKIRNFNKELTESIGESKESGFRQNMESLLDKFISPILQDIMNGNFVEGEMKEGKTNDSNQSTKKNLKTDSVASLFRQITSTFYLCMIRMITEDDVDERRANAERQFINFKRILNACDATLEKMSLAKETLQLLSSRNDQMINLARSVCKFVETIGYHIKIEDIHIINAIHTLETDNRDFEKIYNSVSLMTEFIASEIESAIDASKASVYELFSNGLKPIEDEHGDENNTYDPEKIKNDITIIQQYGIDSNYSYQWNVVNALNRGTMTLTEKLVGIKLKLGPGFN